MPQSATAPATGSATDQTETAAPDVGFLAEILIERELPSTPTVDCEPATPNRVIDLTDTTLTIIDLTDPAPEPTRSDNRWGLADNSIIGRIVTPDHVLAARRAFKAISEGQPLVRSAGTLYQTTTSHAADYLVRHVLGPETVSAAESGDGIARQGDSGTGNVVALARAKQAKDAQHRLAYFLNLGDDDFFACFRFNGEITGEYLTQVDRCERSRHQQANGANTAEASPSQRRRRKARSLRNV